MKESNLHLHLSREASDPAAHQDETSFIVSQYRRRFRRMCEQTEHAHVARRARVPRAVSSYHVQAFAHLQRPRASCCWAAARVGCEGRSSNGARATQPCGELETRSLLLRRCRGLNGPGPLLALAGSGPGGQYHHLPPGPPGMGVSA